MTPTIRELSLRLRAGKISSSALVESAIAQAERSHSVFVTLNADAAREAAAQIDQARRGGRELSPYAGIPLTIKDLFDMQGEVTTAGSRLLAFDEPVLQDAPVIHNLRE